MTIKQAFNKISRVVKPTDAIDVTHTITRAFDYFEITLTASPKTIRSRQLTVEKAVKVVLAEYRRL